MEVGATIGKLLTRVGILSFAGRAISVGESGWRTLVCMLPMLPLLVAMPAAISGPDLRIDGIEPAAPRIALVRTQSSANLNEIELPPISEAATKAHGTIQDHEA